jgi:hypothetical protein
MPTRTKGKRRPSATAAKATSLGTRQARIKVETIDRLATHGSYGDTLDEIIGRLLDKVEANGGGPAAR